MLGVSALAVIDLARWSSGTMAARREQVSLVSPDETGVRSLIARERRIATIHLTPEVTGLGLREAKDLVGTMARGLHGTGGTG